MAPGLAPFTMNGRATERRIPRPQSWYLDLGMMADYTGPAPTRKYHHTAPVAMIMSLHAALGALLDEGLEAAWARHAELRPPSAGRAREDGARTVRRGGSPAAGADDGAGCPTGCDDAVVRGRLLERYGIEIGGGVGAYAGKVWRIGCMGHTARPRNVILLLAALEEVLAR